MLNNIYVELPWLEKFEQEAKTINSIEGMVNIYTKINNLMKNNKINLCNNLLNHIKVENLSDELLVGFPRLTYAFRNLLPDYFAFVGKVKIELIKRNLNPEIELIGII